MSQPPEDGASRSAEEEEIDALRSRVAELEEREAALTKELSLRPKLLSGAPETAPDGQPVTQEALKERAETHNRALLCLIPDMVFRIHRDGTYLDCSLPKETATKVPPSVFLGRRVQDIVPSIAPAVMADIEATLETGALQTLTYELIHEGKPSYYEARTMASGPDEVISIIRDISEQKGLELTLREREARLRALIEQAEKHAEEVARAQSEVIRKLSAPLIPISERVLVMPLIGEFNEERAARVIEALLEGISRRRAEVAILDITGMELSQKDAADALVRCAKAARLLGAQVILTGIRPEVAQALIAVGADMAGVLTLGTLEAGISYAIRRRRAAP
jgi:rsbT co-antagonist protein RsbR